MKAPMSNHVREILNDPKRSNDFMEALITASEKNFEKPIIVNNQSYTFKRCKLI